MPNLFSQLPICIDGRMLSGRGTGVSTYARSLMGAINHMHSNSFVLTASHEGDGRLAKWAGAVSRASRRVHCLSSQDVRPGQLVGRDIFRSAQVHFSVHRRLLPLKCSIPEGIMHWTYPVPLVMEGWVNLYTIHDVIPLIRPDLTPIDARRHRAVLEAICARAERLVTVSEAARGEIVAALGCDPKFVANCGEPVEVGGGVVPCERYGLTQKGYLLYCGTIEARKNLLTVIAAYRASGVTIPLVLVGPDGWRAKPILREAARISGVIRLPYVSRAELLGLIEGARGLVYPSLAEGFGLPVAEAMALGTAVLTSDRGALAEVAGGAALLVDPEDSGAVAVGMARLATDDALSASLVSRGLERARAFSPEAFCERLADAYCAAIASDRFPDYERAS